MTSTNSSISSFKDANRYPIEAVAGPSSVGGDILLVPNVSQSRTAVSATRQQQFQATTEVQLAEFPAEQVSPERQSHPQEAESRSTQGSSQPLLSGVITEAPIKSSPTSSAPAGSFLPYNNYLVARNNVKVYPNSTTEIPRRFKQEFGAKMNILQTILEAKLGITNEEIIYSQYMCSISNNEPVPAIVLRSSKHQIAAIERVLSKHSLQRDLRIYNLANRRTRWMQKLYPSSHEPSLALVFQACGNAEGDLPMREPMRGSMQNIETQLINELRETLQGRHNSLCGARIMGLEGHSLATITCLIQVRDKLFGLTAAHAFQDNKRSVHADLGYVSIPAVIVPGLGRKPVQTRVLIDPVQRQNATNEPDLDYALFSIDDESMLKENAYRLEDHAAPYHSIKEIAKKKPNKLVDVAIISPNGTPKLGYLLPGVTYRARRGCTTVKTWSVALRDGYTIEHGDSGSIVVDMNSHLAYGYVVARETYGHVEVVPLHQTVGQVRRLTRTRQVSLAGADTLSKRCIELRAVRQGHSNCGTLRDSEGYGLSSFFEDYNAEHLNVDNSTPVDVRLSDSHPADAAHTLGILSNKWEQASIEAFNDKIISDRSGEFPDSDSVTLVDECTHGDSDGEATDPLETSENPRAREQHSEDLERNPRFHDAANLPTQMSLDRIQLSLPGKRNPDDEEEALGMAAVAEVPTTVAQRFPRTEPCNDENLSELLKHETQADTEMGDVISWKTPPTSCSRSEALSTSSLGTRRARSLNSLQPSYNYDINSLVSAIQRWDRTPRLAIEGRGGIGKTMLATTFAHWPHITITYISLMAHMISQYTLEGTPICSALILEQIANLMRPVIGSKKAKLPLSIVHRNYSLLDSSLSGDRYEKSSYSSVCVCLGDVIDEILASSFLERRRRNEDNKLWRFRRDRWTWSFQTSLTGNNVSCWPYQEFPKVCCYREHQNLDRWTHRLPGQQDVIHGHLRDYRSIPSPNDLLYTAKRPRSSWQALLKNLMEKLAINYGIWAPEAMTNEYVTEGLSEQEEGILLIMWSKVLMYLRSQRDEQEHLNLETMERIQFLRTLEGSWPLERSLLAKTAPLSSISHHPNDIRLMWKAILSSMDHNRAIQSPPKKNQEILKIGIVCALPLEADINQMVFDKEISSEHHHSRSIRTDSNTYSLGVIGQHNVFLSYFKMESNPGMTENIFRAARSRSLRQNYLLQTIDLGYDLEISWSLLKFHEAQHRESLIAIGSFSNSPKPPALEAYKLLKPKASPGTTLDIVTLREFLIFLADNEDPSMTEHLNPAEEKKFSGKIADYIITLNFRGVRMYKYQNQLADRYKEGEITSGATYVLYSRSSQDRETVGS